MCIYCFHWIFNFHNIYVALDFFIKNIYLYIYIYSYIINQYMIYCSEIKCSEYFFFNSSYSNSEDWNLKLDSVKDII